MLQAQSRPEASARDRMLAGQPYLCPDPELVEFGLRARKLLAQINASPLTPPERIALLSGLLGALGEDSWIETPLTVDYGFNVRIGRGCFLNFGCVLLDSAPITIGDYTAIGPNVQFYTATHPVRAGDRARLDAQGNRVPGAVTLARPITIGEDCWIGGGAIILPGVSIGARSVIGAGSVVTRSIPTGHLAAGNPCRIIRHLDQVP